MTNWVALVLRLCGVWFAWQALLGVRDLYDADRAMHPPTDADNWTGWAIQHLAEKYSTGTPNGISETIYSRIEFSIFISAAAAVILFFGCRWLAWILTRGLDPEFKK